MKGREEGDGSGRQEGGCTREGTPCEPWLRDLGGKPTTGPAEFDTH